jgi:diketogulonate reductase-like aldo/keto reductase
MIKVTMKEVLKKKAELMPDWYIQKGIEMLTDTKDVPTVMENLQIEYGTEISEADWEVVRDRLYQYVVI